MVGQPGTVRMPLRRVATKGTMQFIDILITFGLLAFVSAGGLWFAKLAILGICLVIGLLVFASLRKVPLTQWPIP